MHARFFLKKTCALGRARIVALSFFFPSPDLARLQVTSESSAPQGELRSDNLRLSGERRGCPTTGKVRRWGPSISHPVFLSPSISPSLSLQWWRRRWGPASPAGGAMAFSGDGVAPLRAPALPAPPPATQRGRGSVKQQQQSAIVFLFI